MISEVQIKNYKVKLYNILSEKSTDELEVLMETTRSILETRIEFDNLMRNLQK